MKRIVLTLLLAATLPMSAALAQTTNQERIYGSQMMTQQERNEYRTRMQAAKTEQERNRLREEHHALMQARAKERGVTLPDEMPMRERGMGRSGGMGPGGGRR